MKKALSVTFVLFAIFSLASCGSGNTTSSELSTTSNTTTNMSTQSSIETISSDEGEEFSIETSSSSEIEYSSDEPISSSEEEESSVEEISSSDPERTYSSYTEDSSESTPVAYHVTFQNYDGTTLYETDVGEGGNAIYVGDTPTREGTDTVSYTFKGWDKDCSSVTSDLTVTATYYAVEKDSDSGWGSIRWPD
ncbi:MAG: hypothetical protein E7181_03305 [Erysipelotrichaceae bacterium]|nr:hypothetical protein [Erysipelotrichaceae bacterium]